MKTHQLAIHNDEEYDYDKQLKTKIIILWSMSIYHFF